MKTRSVLSILCLLFISGAVAHGVPSYRVVDLGAIPGYQSYSPTAINNNGVVVGNAYSYSDGSHMPFIWENGTMTALAGTGNNALGINDSKQVVGWTYLWDNGQLGSLDADFTPYAINNDGKVAGFVYPEYQSGISVAIWENGHVADLGTLGGTIGWAFSINSQGHMCGYSTDSMDREHGFFYDGSRLVDIGRFGGIDVRANSINDSDVIVGTFRPAQGQLTRSFRWADGSWQDLGQFDVNAINNRGQIVGGPCVNGSQEDGGFIWEAGIRTQLQSLIPDDTGWTLGTAYDINENGWIVGNGSYQSSYSRGYLLIPVPEPASAASLASLLCCLGLLRRFKK